VHTHIVVTSNLYCVVELLVGTVLLELLHIETAF